MASHYRPPARPPADAWAAVQLARHAERPTAQSYIQRMLPQFVELHGDRQFGDDPAVICGIGDLDGPDDVDGLVGEGRLVEILRPAHGGSEQD